MNTFNTGVATAKSLAAATILSLLVVSVPVSFASAADTGFKAPTDSHSPEEWSNEDNVFTSNNSRAEAQDNSDDDEQGYDDFAFSVPSGATINGIEVVVEAQAEDPNDCEIEARLSWNNGSSYTSDIAQTITSGSDSNYAFGSSSNTWGRTWSDSEFSDANFVLVLEVDDVGAGSACGGSDSVYVDYVAVKVYYTTVSNQTITVTPGSTAPSSATYGDTFNVAATASSGLDVAITTTGGCSGSGTGSANITMTSGTSNCTVHYNQAGNGSYNAAPEVTEGVVALTKNLTISGIDIADKVYDDTAAALITGTAALVGVVGADDVNLTGSVPVATFANDNVGTGKSVSVSGYALAGATASNYNLSQPTGLTADITQKSLTVSASGINRVYVAGSTAATVNLSTADVLGVDAVSLSYTGANFDTEDVGTGKPVSVTGIAISGADSGNYALQNTEAATTANITQETATIVVDDAVFTYDGTAKSVTITGDTNPAGLSFAITYDGSATAPTNGGTYAVLAAITDTNYSGTDSATLTINPADQTITFAALADKITTDPDFQVTATADSGLTVTFEVTGDCSLVGADVVHITGAGSCTVTAKQTGNVNYNAATDVSHTFAITLAPQCSDGINNDDDIRIDSADAGCHSDFNPDNNASYTPNHNDESSKKPNDETGEGSGGGGGGNGPVQGSITPGSVLGASISVDNGQVLGASTSTATSTPAATSTPTTVPTETETAPSCSAGPITEYMRRGRSNTASQVQLLQAFLNKNLGTTLEVTGQFDGATEDAVKAFQTKFASDILAPWGITQPTGYVYILTQWKINTIECPNLEITKPTVR